MAFKRPSAQRELNSWCIFAFFGCSKANPIPIHFSGNAQSLLFMMGKKQVNLDQGPAMKGLHCQGLLM